jgi:hypothetical protein
MMKCTPMSAKCALAFTLAAACGGGQQDLPPDAPPLAIDARPAADNGVIPCGKPIIHLEFGQVRIEHGDVDDARIYESINGGLTIDRIPDETFIAATAIETGKRLAAYGIPMSFNAPPEGDFTMVAFDGIPTELGGDRWRHPLDCTNSNPNNVVLIDGAYFAARSNGASEAAVAVMLAIGWTAGLDIVMALNNCMSYAIHDTCSFVDGVTTTGMLCGATVQDQLAVIRSTYACP